MIVETTIKIPFESLQWIIDVEVAFMKEECTSLLCNRNLIVNGLEISLRGSLLYIGTLREPLRLVKYFFTYNWSAHSSL